jgi:serine/threonine protein kinase
LGEGGLGVVRELGVVGSKPLFEGKSHFVIKSLKKPPDQSMFTRLANEVLVQLQISNMIDTNECHPFIQCFRGILFGEVTSKGATRELLEFLQAFSTNRKIQKETWIKTIFVTSAAIGTFPHMIYERIEGPTLYTLCNLDSDRRTRPANFRQLGLSLLHAVKFLHDRNVVHRDIKPENVMIRGDAVILIDLGLSIGMHRGTLMPHPLAEGTPQYLGPESVLETKNPANAKPSPERLAILKQLDLFATGATLYELLVQESIHGHSVTMGTVSKWWAAPPEGHPPKELKLVWPNDETRPFQEIVTRMVRYRAAERPSLEEAIAVWTAAMEIPAASAEPAAAMASAAPAAPPANAALAAAEAVAAAAAEAVSAANAFASAAARAVSVAENAARAVEGGRRVRRHTRRLRTKKHRSKRMRRRN